MSVILRVSYREALKYKGKTVNCTVDGKKHNAYFKVICDDLDLESCIELAKTSKNILMLDYQGIDGAEVPDGIYVGKSFDWGSNITDSDVDNIVENELPKGMTAIIKLPDGYKNIEFVWRMSQKYPNVRFCGGTFFCATGCNLGCCGIDILDKRGIKHTDSSYMREGCCCGFQVLDLSDVSDISVGEVKQKSSSSSSSKKKPKISFSSLLFQSGKFE